MSNHETRADEMANVTRPVKGTITFGDFEIGYDAQEHASSGELVRGSIEIMRWQMKGEDWTDDQLRKVYMAIDAAVMELSHELSAEDIIEESHEVARHLKLLSDTKQS